MSVSTEKVLIYDSHCPLCNWYTDEFIRQGIIPKSGRKPFDKVGEREISLIDSDKARHEIPLIDTNGGKTIYGLDSLIYLLGNKYKVIRKVLGITPIYMFFKALYSLISYNRRVISGNNEQSKNFDCQPDFNLTARWVFIAMSVLVGSLMAIYLGEELEINSSLFNTKALFPAMATSWMIIVGVSRIMLPFHKWMDYIGHLATLLMLGSLVFIPWMFFNSVFPSPYSLPLLVGMLASSAIMIKDHFRRVHNYQLPKLLNWLWLCAWIFGFGMVWV